jgi:putative restriction modification system, type I similar to hsdS
MEITVGNLIKKAKLVRCGGGEYPVLSMTMHDGLMFQNDRFKKQIASIDKSKYQIVYRHQLVESFPIDEGVLAVQELTEAGIVSPAYKIWDVNMEKVVPKYLEFALRAPRSIEYYKSKLRGTTARRRSITDTEFCAMKINCPSLIEQERIVDVIEKTKNIINVRRLELDTLDNLIKARFVEMFGDPIKNPKGWKVATIGDVVTEVRYGTSKPAVEGGKYPYIRMNNITSDGHLDLNDLKYIDIPDDEIEKCVVRKGDVLFNRTNSVELVGKTAFFDLPQDMVIAGYIIRLRLSEKMLPEVLVQYMNLEALKKILRSMAKGAVNQANINAQELQSIKLYIPDMDLQKQFIEMKGQIDKSKVLSETHIFYAEKSITPTTPEIFLKGRCIYGNEF